MSGILEWGEPPKPREAGYGVDWEVVVAALKLRPGEWAKVCDLSTTRKAHDLATNLKRGRYKAVPPESVEVVARAQSGRGGVWMRWVDVAAGQPPSGASRGRSTRRARR